MKRLWIAGFVFFACSSGLLAQTNTSIKMRLGVGVHQIKSSSDFTVRTPSVLGFSSTSGLSVQIAIHKSNTKQIYLDVGLRSNSISGVLETTPNNLVRINGESRTLPILVGLEKQLEHGTFSVFGGFAGQWGQEVLVSQGAYRDLEFQETNFLFGIGVNFPLVERLSLFHNFEFWSPMGDAGFAVAFRFIQTGFRWHVGKLK